MKPNSHQATCVVCAQPGLTELDIYRQLPRVTSDCKPWPSGGRLFVCNACGTIQKSNDAEWKKEISLIYGAYEIYALSNGAEQVIFSASGQASPRSQTLVNFIVSQLPTRSPGHLLDIGCGNGSALANFGQALPGWKLDGSELSESALSNLKKIPGFDTLHTGPIDRTYDLITLIHSLEHMESPASSIAEAASMLRPGGTLFIEVPDAETSLFDFLVADHRSHFTKNTLARLIAQEHLSLTFLGNEVLPKEITALISKNSVRPIQVSTISDGMELASRALMWLQSIIDQASDLSSKTTIGIFGTSISASWLYGALKDRVDFFVDEDPTRVGQHIEGRPILAPGQVPDSGTIYLPLAPNVAAAVQRRLNERPGNYVLPPPLSSYFRA